MGNVLFSALALTAIGFGMVNRRAFILTAILAAGVPIALMTGNTRFFVALGGMSGQAAWLFAIVIGCAAALIGSLGRLPGVVAQTPLFLAFLILAAMSLSWTDNVLDGLRMLAKLAAPILFLWVVFALKPDARLRRRIETVLYVSCMLAVVLALANTVTGGAIAPLPLKRGLAGIPALAAPFTSPANFSFLILVGALAAYCRFLETRRVIHIVLFLLFIIVIAFAFVRITLAGALLGIAVAHLVRARPVATVVCAVLAVGATAALVSSDAFMERTFFVPDRVRWSEAITQPEKFLSNINTSGRTMLWARAGKAFEEQSPWLGAGVGSVDTWINSGDSFSSELHSEVFRLKLETGWLGLGLFSLGFLALWMRVLRRCRQAPRDAPLAAIRTACAVLPAYALTLLTDNTLNYASEFGVAVHAFAAMALLSTADEPASEPALVSPDRHEAVAIGS